MTAPALSSVSGNENIPFRSNSGSNLNRLMLSISPGKCTLLREQKVRHPRAGGSGHSGPYSDGGRGYSIDSLPPGWKQAGLRAVDRRSAAQTDNRPPARRNSHYRRRLRPPDGRARVPDHQQLALSSITLSAKSVAKNGNAETDLVLTKEEDAIPGSVSGTR